MQKVTFESLPDAVQELGEKLANIEGFLHKLIEEPQDDKDRFLTVEEAAQFLHYAKQTLYNKVSRKEIEFHKRGGRIYFSKVALVNYIEDGKQEVISDTNKDLVNV